MVRFLLGLALAGATFWAVRRGTGDPALAIFLMSMVAIGVWFSAFRCRCEPCVQARG